MAIISLAGIVAGIGGAVSWFASLPNEFKYIIFLGGLGADAGISQLAGFEQGAIGSAITLIISQTFSIPLFVVTSLHLLIIFTFFPLFRFLLKNSLSHQ